MDDMTAAPALPHSRAGRSNRVEFATLIEVPTIVVAKDAVGVRRAGNRGRIEIERGWHRAHPPRRQVRRRLKREVKYAALVILACMPLSYEASRVWSSRLGNIAATNLTQAVHDDDVRESADLGSTLAAKVSRTVFEPAVVLMSIEPAQTGIKADAEPPVIFPGYLLPEDSLEEKANEGS